jgi:hypothetical protein
MNKIIKLYKKFTQKNKLLTTFLYSMIFILFIFVLVYNIYKKIIRQKMYVGCLYSSTGVLGNASYDNYKILLESFKFFVKKYDCDIDIVPIYKDLGDELDNYSKWIEECVKKYDIKYFFGCWRSSERQRIIPILQKYNLRLFYPVQYEGVELSKNIYYFGSCPNQHLIPGLQYMFDIFYFYKDVYIIGSDYSYPKVSIELIKQFTEKNKSNYDKNIVYSKLYSLEETDFSDFILTVFKKSPNGAIIINLINGKSFYSFSKQFHEMYYDKFPNNTKKIASNQSELMKYVSNPNIENILKKKDRYPCISTSIVENDILKEHHTYLDGMLFVANFGNDIITNKTFYINDGYEESDLDMIFLTDFYHSQNKPIGDAQYNSFISANFFVSIICDIMKRNGNIYDTDEYDKFKIISKYSIAGEHAFIENNHITKVFFMLVFSKNKINITYQHLKAITPYPIGILSDKKIILSNAVSEVINISDRLII